MFFIQDVLMLIYTNLAPVDTGVRYAGDNCIIFQRFLTSISPAAMLMAQRRPCCLYAILMLSTNVCHDIDAAC